MTQHYSRRAFVVLGGAAAAAAVYKLRSGTTPVEAMVAMPKEVKIVQFTSMGQRQDAVVVPTIVKTDEEWRKQLSKEAFEVTRHADTERPFTGELLNVHEKGIFRCICCDTALFNSNTKFDSGTGWPSFYQPIAAENVHEIKDSTLGMERIAVSCRRCEAHLGHVFDDGPNPTGLRYCMNSVSMKFVKFA